MNGTVRPNDNTSSYPFIFVALAERILVDCHDIVVVVDFVVLESLLDASQLNDDDVVEADDPALFSKGKTNEKKII